MMAAAPAEQPAAETSPSPLVDSAVLLASLTPHTGNAITADRLANALPARQLTRCDVNAFASPADLAPLLARVRADVVVGVHAYRSGRLLLDCGVPYIIVLGGTDMNEHLHEKRRGGVIRSMHLSLTL